MLCMGGTAVILPERLHILPPQLQSQKITLQESSSKLYFLGR